MFYLRYLIGVPRAPVTVEPRCLDFSVDFLSDCSGDFWAFGCFWRAFGLILPTSESKFWTTFELLGQKEPTKAGNVIQNVDQTVGQKVARLVGSGDAEVFMNFLTEISKNLSRAKHPKNGVFLIVC